VSGHAFWVELGFVIRRLLVGILLIPWSALAAVSTGGWVTAMHVATNAAGNRSVVFTLAPTGAVEVTPYAPDVVRVRFHFTAVTSFYQREEIAIAKPFTSWPAFAMTITNASATNVVIETDQLRIDVVTSNKVQVNFRDKSGYDLLRDFQIEYDTAYQQMDDTNAYAQVAWPSGSTSVSNLPSGFKLKSVKYMPTNVAFFGGGGFGGPLNRRGTTLQYWNQDTFAWEERRNPSYLSLPFYYGVVPQTATNPAFAYGLFFNNPARPVIEFQSGFGDTYAFHAGDDQLDYFFFGGGTGHTMQAALDRYTELTGRPAFLPKWAYGYHQSRHSYTNQQIVQDLADAFRDRDIPLDAIYLDIDTQQISNNLRHQLTFNTGFTNVAGMISYCTNQGVRLVPIIEPCLTTNDPLYAEADSSLYFIKTNSLATYVGSNFLGSISWIDFSQSDFARPWWIGKVTNYLAQYPFECIWNDLNEPNENAMPLNNLYYLDGRYGDVTTNDTRRWHATIKNTFGNMVAGSAYEALQRRDAAKRPFVLSRSGWPGIQRYAAGWSGDNLSSFDNLRYNIRQGLGVMISGQPNFGHDIGGFAGDSNGELFGRWLQFGVMNPFCRNHTLNGTADQEPWVYGEPYTLWNRRWIKYRYELMPYLYTLAHDAATNGRPFNTPTVFHFASDVNTFSANEYDFMVGDSILVAPVYTSNTTSRSVYLPSGADWYFWENDRFYSGGQTALVPASLGSLPQFFRAGGIVPMGPAMGYADAAAATNIDVHCWPGASNSFTLFEDDGLTTNHAAGQYAMTRFGHRSEGSTWTFTVGAREGLHDPGDRSFYMTGHAASNVTGVTLDGQALARYANRYELAAIPGNGWCYSFPQRRLTVKVVDDAADHTVVASFDTGTYAYASFASAFTSMAVVGNFQYWNEAAANMRLMTDVVWAGVFDLAGQSNLEFKFVANNSWTFTNWGANAQSDVFVPIDNTASPLGSNLTALGTFTGLYTFTFNEITRVFSLYPAGQRDSDKDGADDHWEYDHGLDPLARSDGALDADNDGLANTNEYLAGGDPLRSDTDEDGVDDLSEFIAGTALTNASSYFFIAAETRVETNNSVVVRWNAVTGRTYEVFYTTNLLAGAGWQTLNGFTNVTGTGTVSVADTNVAADRTYRVGVRKP
jgi:alpha-glucosidase